MPESRVFALEDIRERRQARRGRAVALHLAEPDRSRILVHLARAVDRLAGDRGAVVWIDEYGPGIVHPHVVLDLASDVPRRDFPVELFERSWEDGVPGFVDEPDLEAGGEPSTSGRSRAAVSLGSDGVRCWFLVVESLAPRQPLGPDDVEKLLFLAGECAGIVLHADLAEDEPRSGPASWRVLQDVVASGGTSASDDVEVSGRFLVLRGVRSVVEDELAVERDALEGQIEGIRRELEPTSPDSAEASHWMDVLAALHREDWSSLGERLLGLGRSAENRQHWHGAGEAYGLARRVAAAVGAVDTALEAARALGRVQRKRGDWEGAIRWFETAAESARMVGDTDRTARAIESVATVHINRGGLPAARRLLEEAWRVAERGSRPRTKGAVLHSMMTVAHTEGRLRDAVRMGWRSVRAYDDVEDRLAALTALGGVFLEGRELRAAERAFQIVLSRVRDRVFELYARAGLALVAAHRGDRRRFEDGLAELERAGFSTAPPELRAEVLLEIGDGYLALRDEEETRRWYRRSLETAEAHDLSEYVIRAEEAIVRLDRQADTGEEATTATDLPLLPQEELAEIRGGLGVLEAELDRVGYGAVGP